MIGFLRGEIVAVDEPYIVVDVGGVGYSVVTTKDVLSKTEINSKLKLFIHTHVREDLIQLYGFLDITELKLFKNLIGVSGIGPKTAMGIFGIGSRDAIIEAIIKGDVDFFMSVPRLGKKNAQKVIIELKNKFGSIEDLDLSLDDSQNSEVITALQNFGYSRKEALGVLKNTRGKGETTEEKIRMALRELGK